MPEVDGPLVTVVMAVFNGAAFVGEALDSVLGQHYRPLEVIVVDDGSQDDTAKVVGRFSSVRYIRQDNQGPAAARNRGIAAATGEFIAFADHDDRLPPTKLTVQVGHLVAHPEVGCVLGRQEILLEPGATPPDWLRRDRVLNDLGGINFITAVIRRAVLEQVGGFDRSFRTAEDRDLLVRLRAAGVGIEVLPDVVLQRRVHDANLSNENTTRSTPHPLLRSLRATIDRRREAPAPDEAPR